MADTRQDIGAKLGAALQAIKSRAVSAFLAARQDPKAPLTADEIAAIMRVVWAAVGSAVVPVSPDGTVQIGTQKDDRGDPQLTLQAQGGGAEWHSSDGTPPDDLGQDGDFCIDLGEDDAEHPRPTRWYTGTGAPADSLGYENDLYLDTGTGNAYRRGATTWGEPVCNLKGSSGTATAVHETGGPTDLAIGIIAEGKLVKRVGTSLVGVDPPTTAPTGTGWRHVTDGVEDAAASTPTADAVGALATTTRGTANGVASLDANTKIPIDQIPTGTASGTVASGDDARFTATVPESRLSLSDVTTGNATAATHGLLAKLSGASTDYVGGDNQCHALPGSSPPTPGASLITAYSVNFAALANQTLSNGAVTIDGKSAVVANAAKSQTFAIQNGNGLYIRAAGSASSDNSNGNLQAPAIYWPITGLAPSLNCVGLAEVWILLMLTSPRGLGYSYEYRQGGLILLPTGATYAAANIHRFNLQSGYGGSGQMQGDLQVTYLGGTSLYRGSTSGSTPLHDVFALHISGNLIEAFTGISSGGDFPALTATSGWTSRGVASLVNPATGVGPALATIGNLAVWVSLIEAQQYGNSDVLLSKMKVLVR